MEFEEIRKTYIVAKYITESFGEKWWRYGWCRVSVQGVKWLGGHFACLCRGFEFYEVKKNVIIFQKRKWKYVYTFNQFYSEKSSKREK